MKVKGAKQVHYEAGPNMTPLVDVVMVILIFMMLAGKFAANERYLTSNTPVTQKGASGDKDAKPEMTKPLEVKVDSPNGPGAGFVCYIEGQGVNTPEAVVARLNQLRAGYEATGTKADDVQIIISPRKFVTYGDLVAVFESAMNANFSKISFATAY